MSRFRSACCEGERCWCGTAADHKVEEILFHDDPTAFGTVEGMGEFGEIVTRHPLTSYICHHHFRQLMGPAAGE